MGRIFKRNHSKKKNTQHDDNEASDNDSSNNSSRINEEVDIPSIKSPNPLVRPSINDEEVQKHSSATWPRLPEIALTTSQDSRTYRPVELVDSPSLSASSSQAFLGIDNFAHNNMREDYTRQSAYENANIGTDSETDTEVNVDAAIQRGRETFYDDTQSFSSASRLPSLNNDQHKTGFALDDSAAATLVEAALDKEEAKDRHVRFQDHVAESAALVQRMLSVKMGHHHREPDPLAVAIQSRHESRNEEEFELESPSPILGGGGSVLASLMRLEASRHDGEAKNNKKGTKVSTKR